MCSAEEALAVTAYASASRLVEAVSLEAEGLGEEVTAQVQLPWLTKEICRVGYFEYLYLYQRVMLHILKYQYNCTWYLYCFFRQCATGLYRTLQSTCSILLE